MLSPPPTRIKLGGKVSAASRTLLVARLSVGGAAVSTAGRRVAVWLPVVAASRPTARKRASDGTRPRPASPRPPGKSGVAVGHDLNLPRRRRGGKVRQVTSVTGAE